MGFTRRRCLMKTEYIAKDTFDKTVSELRQQIANLTSTVSAIGGGYQLGTVRMVEYRLRM